MYGPFSEIFRPHPPSRGIRVRASRALYILFFFFGRKYIGKDPNIRTEMITKELDPYKDPYKIRTTQIGPYTITNYQ